MADYKSMLTRAGISSGEVSIIVHNLEKLEGAGFRGRLDDVVNKVIKDSSFRSSFMRDYRVAMR
ncbi:hypothetical protein EU527_09000 [Candidatus Thorarchaeota archaeon]|nr:MAG: hypothetical protein EU527_09000 [Candidatus Thorarchaeota archaeon]